MMNKSPCYRLILVFVLVAIGCCQPCQKDQVWNHGQCLYCYRLPHTVESAPEEQKANYCSCANGYGWSGNEVACLKITHLRTTEDFQIHPQVVEEEANTPTSRLLTITCDTSNGFIFKNNQCINCRDIPYSNGYAKSSIQCYCNLPFIWWTYFQMCGCYIENVNSVYMSSSSTCSVCNSLSNTTLSEQCLACNGGPFGYGAYGCVNCTAIPFATGAIFSAGVGSCSCQTGYTFNFYMGACICSNRQRYGIIGNGSCVACSSLTPASLYIACYLCSPPFYYDGYVCIHSSLIAKLPSTSRTCSPNFVFATNPVTNKTVRCVCSNLAGFYTNASSCLSCTTQPIPGIAVDNCIACSVDSGFYLATQECIYCLNAPYTTGVATINGCQCIANYFWSSLTSSCQCDWMLGYYGAPGTCINCYQLSNTVSAISTKCICIAGYAWNGTQCVCDTNNGAFFSATQCINCNTMIGALVLVAGGNSCACILGYIWSSTLGTCVCDYTNNFYQMNGFCYDCGAIPNTAGTASLSGCSCIPTLIWISSLGVCDCPPGFVNMGSYCGNCGLITLPTGATIIGCRTCNTSQGFTRSGGICYACSKQQYTSNVITSGGCGCLNSSLIWQASLSSCVCNYAIRRITMVVGRTLSCVACIGSTCSCGYPGTGTVNINGICINCASILYGTGLVSNGLCVCFPGYAFSTSVYPHQCYCSFRLGYYLAGSSCNSCTALASTGRITMLGCQICSSSQGFLLLPNDTCILCSSLPNTNGAASPSGCGCSIGFWDPVRILCSTFTCPAGFVFSPQNQVCICNATNSINSGSQCVSCSNVTNSTGEAQNSTACVCISNNSWYLSRLGVGTCALSCNPATSVMNCNVCTDCFTVQYSNGPVLGTNNCQCPPALVWVFTNATKSGACVCQDPLKYLVNGNACVCNSTFSMTVITGNNVICFDCRTVPYSTNLTASGQCGCINNFNWDNAKQLCKCFYPYVPGESRCICDLKTSLMIGNQCYTCQLIQFSTGLVSGANSCQCLPTLVWVYTGSIYYGACVCQDPLKIPSADGSSCICNPSYAVSANYSSCLDCRTIQHSTNSTLSDFCGCQATFVWNTASFSCVCPSGYVLSGSQCICNTTTSALIGNTCVNCRTIQFSSGPIKGTNNCMCPSTLIWVYQPSINSGNCVCKSPLQIPSSDASSCLCNPLYAIPSNNPTINVCLDCRTVQYSTNSTVSNSCGCQTNFVWSRYTQTCQCLFPDKISAGQCSCDLNISVLLGNICLDCFTITFSTGPQVGTNKCQCPISLLWTFNSEKNSGACVCQDPLTIPSADGSSCLCNPLYAILAFNATSTSICIDCRTVQYSSNTSNNQSCDCLSNYSWNNITQSCVCLTPFVIITGKCICEPSSTILINGSCFACSTDPFSTGLAYETACLCTSPMIWNGAACVCNITSVYVADYFNSSTWQCVDCTGSTTFTLAKISSTTCSCIDSNLVWNSLGYCDCGSNSAMIIASTNSYVCVVCDSSVYSTGQRNSYSCACPSPLTWNPVTLTCGCDTSAVLKVLPSGLYSCLVCNSTIYATSVADTVSCNCLNSLFVWQADIGCVCSDPQAAIVGLDSQATCVVCDSSIYSIGGDPASNNCLCRNNLRWINGTCQCSANYALLPNISCVYCGASLEASGLLNTTACSCISNFLTWLPAKGICGCIDDNCIFTGSGTLRRCRNCSNAIYATTPKTQFTCNCMSPNLTWNNNSKACDCGGLNKAFYLSGSNFICIDCTNPVYFTLSRRISNSCNCLSSALVWSATTGTCQCNSSSAVIFTSGNSYLCVICNSAIFASGRLNSQVCNCLGSVLTWSSTAGSCTCNSNSVVYVAGNYSCITCSSAVYAASRLNATTCSCMDASFIWTGNFCNCSAGSIILPSLKCLACPTLTTLSNFTCSCSTTSSANSIWNDITQTCVTCGSTAVPNSVAGYYGVACACAAGYIWDVMTNACISSCSGTGCTMNCASIPNVANATPVLTSSITARNLPGGTSMRNFYLTAGSNHASISSMACQCILGYSWDSQRLRCYSSTISLSSS